MTDGVSDDDDNSESTSVDSMANRKRKLNTILCSNKRMHVEPAIGKADTDNDSDSNHEANDHGTSINDNDDGTSSRMSDFDDGKCRIYRTYSCNSLFLSLQNFTIQKKRE